MLFRSNRFGPALTPFFETGIVRAALAVPLRHKRFGRFEAAMIERLNPDLAAHPSGYGHPFCGSIPLKRRLKEWSSVARPPELRRYAYRLKSRWERPDPPYYLSARYLEPILGRDFPYMSNFFRTAVLVDPPQKKRLCTLEYFCQAYSPGL